ncbi:MAG: 4-hydroxy-tetrahydrodipicolinate synthase, partial [Thermoplasmata archaeon]|nr:4-hydroxy-tetrahydrodipicolinate synthase [Thermoplasmata archaeon]
MFSGSLVALVTPFKNGEVDHDKLKELVEFHIKNGTDVIVPCGTTGESPTLSHDEHGEVVESVIKCVDGRVPVVAGAGSNSTREALSLTKHAKEVGANAVLSVTPYYNKPTQAGLIEHYRTIANEVEIPLIMYNVPGRTGTKIMPETIARLSEEENIVAVKEACGSIEQVCEILSLCDITVLSGDDSLTYPMLAVGAMGVISVAANVIPKEVAEMVRLFYEGDAEGSREIHYKYWRVFKDLFIETNPIP